MKNENITKINKLGKVSRVILAIMRIACSIGLIACIVGMLIVPFVPNKEKFWAKGDITANIEAADGASFMISKGAVKIAGFKIDSIEELEELDGTDIEFFGATAKVNVDKTQNDGSTKYVIKADASADNGKLFFWAIELAMLTGVVICAVLLVITKYGFNLAKAIEECDTPFSDTVITAMKKFVYSFIPLGVCYVIGGGISATGVLLVIALIIFMYIFRYGAELQKEADETL